VQDFADFTFPAFKIFGNNPRRGSTGGSFGSSGVFLNGKRETGYSKGVRSAET